MRVLSLLPPWALAFCLRMPFPPAQWPQWAMSIGKVFLGDRERQIESSQNFAGGN